jgi:predicted dehydrogenase
MRFGFVGLGFATRWLHLPAVRGLAGCVAVGGVDTVESRQEEWAGADGGPVFRSLEELLEQARPDIVVVATPPESHAQLCVSALEAGAHVICEKPFVSSVAEADRVLEVARANGRRVAVNHEFRYMPIFAAVPSQAGRADVGRPVFLHCTQFMDLPPWKEEVPWRAAMPDRSLFEGGVHLVDLFHMIVGRVPESVFAKTSSGLDLDRRADAIHLVTLDYGDGLLGQITIDRLCRAGTRYVDLRVDCEEASIRSSYGGRAFVRLGLKRAERPGIRVDIGPEGLAWIERGLQRKVVARNARRATQKATQALYSEAVEAFRRDEEPPTTAHIARETMRIIEAAYRSARTGAPVSLDT